MSDDYGDRLDDLRSEDQRMLDDERRRFLEEHPDYDRCPKHPDRPVVDSGVCTLRFCAECIEDHKARATEPRLDAWITDDTMDMRYYSDHPRYSREDTQ